MLFHRGICTLGAIFSIVIIHERFQHFCEILILFLKQQMEGLIHVDMLLVIRIFDRLEIFMPVSVKFH